MMNSMVRNSTSAQRGVALLISISVLVVVTILVMALAFASGEAQQSHKTASIRIRADNLARSGFDLSFSTLSKLAAPLAESKTYEISFEEGKCRIGVSPAKMDDAIYGGSFVRPRQGDLTLNIEVQPKGAPAGQAFVYRYLINADPAKPRRLLYDVKAQQKGR